MSSAQNVKKYLEIPGEKTLVYTFKFNMDLPPPVPQPKTMFVPLDAERYIKPKLTLFQVKRKPVLMTDINLSIPVDEIQMHPELYNPAPDAKFELSDKDRELLEERPIQDLKKATPKKVAVDVVKPKDQAAAEANGKSKAAEADKKTKLPGSGKKEETKKLSIEEEIRRSFDIAKSYKVGAAHPSREGLVCEEVLEILPDFSNILSSFYVIKTEVSTETLKTKENLLRFDNDVDQKPILAIYSQKSLFVNEEQDQMDKELKKKRTEVGEGLDEEDLDEGEKNGEGQTTSELANDPLLKKVENFEHVGNYIYSNPKPIGGIKKDFLLNLKKGDGKAFIYPTQPVLIKKKKVQFSHKTAYRGDDDEDDKRKETAKTIKMIKKKQDKKDLLLKKRTYDEYHLSQSDFNKENQRLLDEYEEEENEEELDQIKKKLIKEEEVIEEEDEIDQERDLDRDVDENKMEVEDEEEQEEEEEEEEQPAEDKGDEDEEEHYKGSEKGDDGEAHMEEEKEEVKAPEESKPAEKKEDNAVAQEMADLFDDDDD